MGSIFRHKGRTVWWVQYYVDGKAIRKSAKTKDKREARQFLAVCQYGPKKEVTKKPTDPLDIGFIYIIRCEQYFKIGRTLDVRKRFATLAVTIPISVQLIFDQCVAYHSLLEACLHDHFRNHRHKGEWFELKPLQVEEAKRMIIEWIKNPNRLQFDSIALQY